MGASKGQIIALAGSFKQFDHNTSFVPETSLHALLCEMDAPLGYRDELGTVVYTPQVRKTLNSQILIP